MRRETRRREGVKEEEVCGELCGRLDRVAFRARAEKSISSSKSSTDPVISSRVRVVVVVLEAWRGLVERAISMEAEGTTRVRM